MKTKIVLLLAICAAVFSSCRSSKGFGDSGGRLDRARFVVDSLSAALDSCQNLIKKDKIALERCHDENLAAQEASSSAITKLKESEAETQKCSQNAENLQKENSTLKGKLKVSEGQLWKARQDCPEKKEVVTVTGEVSAQEAERLRNSKPGDKKNIPIKLTETPK